MRKDSVYKNFYKNILVNDLGIGFPIQNLYNVPSLQRITLHNTSHAPLLKRGEIFSPWAASLLIGGRKGNLLVSKKSVSGFKLKEKSLLGCSLSFRGEPLYQFLDKFFVETLPRELSNRSENWTPALEWQSASSVAESFVPCFREKPPFTAVPALAIMQDVRPADPLLHRSMPASLSRVYISNVNPANHFKKSDLPSPLQRSSPLGGKPNPISLEERKMKKVKLQFGELKEKTIGDIRSLSRYESSQHSSFLSPLELQKKLSGKRKTRGVKALSKEYNVGVRFCFSFQDLESCFHLFQHLRGFDITFLFSTSLKIVC